MKSADQPGHNLHFVLLCGIFKMFLLLLHTYSQNEQLLPDLSPSLPSPEKTTAADYFVFFSLFLHAHFAAIS